MYFTNAAAKKALIDIIRAVNQPENSRKLSEAKNAAGVDMLLTIEYVFPLVMQLEKDVIKLYGFADNRKGLQQFLKLITEKERDDLEIAQLRSYLRAMYLPAIAINIVHDLMI